LSRIFRCSKLIKETRIMEWEQVWDRIYANAGEVQKDVLPTVVSAAELFKSAGVRSVLDLGCGTGRHSIFLAESGFEVTAADISEHGVAITKERAREKGLDIRVHNFDMRKIPFDDNTFDAVICVWTSGHGLLEDMIAHKNDMVRVTKPGGFIFVDYVSKQDENYGKGVEIEKDTFIKNTPGEEEIPHHYTDEYEIAELYKGDGELKISPYRYSYTDGSGNINYIHALVAICRKKIC
jgi:ubiquinone/menaquinone biosynthesis C-methylase UbiE